MLKLHIISLLVIADLQSTAYGKNSLDSIYIRCGFLNSVNLTGAYQFLNKSYLHEGNIYPPEMVEEYDYELNLTHRFSTKRHKRGCICHMKPCIRFCCPKNQYLNEKHQCEELTTSQQNGIKLIPSLNVLFGGTADSDETAYKNGYFDETYGIPCDQGRFLDLLLLAAYREWDLLGNGSLVAYNGYRVYPKEKFCMSPQPSSYYDEENFYLNPYLCDADYVENQGASYSIVMLLSIPFILATIFVYAVIPELRNFHGKCLICYLTSLAIGYVNNLILSLINSMEPLPCFFLGYTRYFFLIASFFWLNIMSFDLWWNFRKTKYTFDRSSERKRFLKYSIYGWGLPLILLVVIVCLDHAGLSNRYEPGVKSSISCWLQVSHWIALAYYFGPILCIITINTIMFAQTTFRIRTIQKATSKVMAGVDCSQNIQNPSESIGMFLRLFATMGVGILLVEPISWIIKQATDSTHWILDLSDIFNGIQAVLVFWLFVIKRKVKELIVKRYRKWKDSGQSSNRNTDTGRSNNKFRSSTNTESNNLELKVKVDIQMPNDIILCNDAELSYV